MTAAGSARRGIPRADPPRRRRVVGGLVSVAVALLLSVGLAGCASQAAFGLVQQACRHVERSLALYRSSQTQPDPAVAARQQAQAQSQLQAASPLASEAAGQAPQWQALMATLAENTRLPESDLVHALSAQCASVRDGGILVPNQSPATTLPAAPPGDRGEGLADDGPR